MKKIAKCPVCNSNLIANVALVQETFGLLNRNDGYCCSSICKFRCDTIVYHDGIIFKWDETLGLDDINSLFLMDNYLYIPDRLVDG